MVKEKVKDKVLSKKEALEKAKEDYANNPTINEEEEQNEIDKNVKLNRELYLQNQKANPDDTI